MFCCFICTFMVSFFSTPRARRTRVTSISDRYEEPSAKTPRSKRSTKHVETCSTPSKIPSKTPKNRAKLIREGVITPSMQQRSKAVASDSTPLMKARSQLHVSYVPKSLPCREKEYADVYGFLHGKLFDGCGGWVFTYKFYVTFFFSSQYYSILVIKMTHLKNYQ